MEIWKDIKGYEGLYQVSNLGNVRSLDRKISLYNGGEWLRKGKILKPIKNYQGYMKIHLLKEGITKSLLIHRLVAQAFILNTNNLAEVNHKNEIKSDNKVENLEWCTQEYNKKYGTAIERSRTKKMKVINQYDLEGNYIKTWKGLRETQKETGLKNQGISLCCLKKRKMCGGYQWRFYEEEKECKNIGKYIGNRI